MPLRVGCILALGVVYNKYVGHVENAHNVLCVQAFCVRVVRQPPSPPNGRYACFFSPSSRLYLGKQYQGILSDETMHTCAVWSTTRLAEAATSYVIATTTPTFETSFPFGMEGCSPDWVASADATDTPYDLNNGFVSYKGRDEAESLGLIAVRGDEVYMGVDHENTFALDGAARPSVRLTSVDAYQYGLFVVDFTYLPPPNCGVWPALCVPMLSV
jgi:hypothetical protein